MSFTQGYEAVSTEHQNGNLQSIYPSLDTEVPKSWDSAPDFNAPGHHHQQQQQHPSHPKQLLVNKVGHTMVCPPEGERDFCKEV